MRAGALLTGIAVSILAACGGGSESAESRICVAANGCGIVASANVSWCVSALEDIDGDRAKAECADCLEATTCAQIAAGACTAACGAFEGAFSGPGIDPNKRPRELTPAELAEVCEYLIDQSGGPGAQEKCGPDYTVMNPTQLECVNRVGTFDCPATVGQIYDCLEVVNSPCDYIFAPECSAFRVCLGGLP